MTIEQMRKDFLRSFKYSIAITLVGFILDVIIFSYQPPFDHHVMFAGFLFTMILILFVQFIVLSILSFLSLAEMVQLFFRFIKSNF